MPELKHPEKPTGRGHVVDRHHDVSERERMIAEEIERESAQAYRESVAQVNRASDREIERALMG